MAHLDQPLSQNLNITGKFSVPQSNTVSYLNPPFLNINKEFSNKKLADRTLHILNENNKYKSLNTP